MRERWLLPVLSTTLCLACSEPVILKQFGDISVSDPMVSGSQLQVEVVNKTGEELCYFRDGLFYGPGVNEGGSGETEIMRPAVGAQTLEEIKISRTNRLGIDLILLPPEGGRLSIEISGQEAIQAGDDVSFDLVFCKPEQDGRHRSLVYSSRLK